MKCISLVKVIFLLTHRKYHREASAEGKTVSACQGSPASVPSSGMASPCEVQCNALLALAILSLNDTNLAKNPLNIETNLARIFAFTFA